MIILFYLLVILKLNGLLKIHGDQDGELMVMLIFQEILIMIVVLVVRYIYEVQRLILQHAKYKIVKVVFNKTIVQNVNLVITWLQKIVNIAVYNAHYQTVRNVKIVLDIVVHVSMDMLYISLIKPVNCLLYKTVKIS